MQADRFPKSNLHTHTCFCDGRDTPEQIVQAAIGLKMETLGFSGHSWVHFDPECAMNPEETAAYRNEILRLRKIYGEQIGILLGIEQDYYADDRAVGYDHVIGSVHYLLRDGHYWAVDRTREEVCELRDACFGGDIYAYIKCYYETVAGLIERTGANVVGHVDLITKFNADGSLFDENDPRYLHAALDAVDALLERAPIFEVNTGAIARGYRNFPYPADALLRRICEKRGRVTLSSDAHAKENLLYGFADACERLRAVGFATVAVMTRSGWTEMPL